MSDFPSDEILYQRAKNVVQSRDQSRGLEQDVADGRATQEEADPLLKQYERDKQLIAEWAESGPYVHETKAFALGVAPVIWRSSLLRLHSIYSAPSTRSKSK